MELDEGSTTTDWKEYVNGRKLPLMSDAVKRVLGETGTSELEDQTITALISNDNDIRIQGNDAAHPRNKHLIAQGVTSSTQGRDILTALFRFVYGEEATLS
ncbi:hypothetical protein EUX98_g9734 [Antrodiella citrinella]|uniref:Uncharacterized protein n=1 Tax=Antrodiella citrinella TaxID=2447956 RepID=A0A4V3XEE6_9APHY|nr:hypothetical protein EUX98_g9734 [Antrodiella citrinella]